MTVHRIFIDTEFIDNGEQLHLISLGAVDATGEREFYLEAIDPPWHLASDWVNENVAPHLRGPETQATRPEIAHQFHRWVKEVVGYPVGEWEVGDRVEMWAWAPAYDWVVISQLYGPLVNRPVPFPWNASDLDQLGYMLGMRSDEWPGNTRAEHDALADAHFHREVFDVMRKRAGKALHR